MSKRTWIPLLLVGPASIIALLVMFGFMALGNLGGGATTESDAPDISQLEQRISKLESEVRELRSDVSSGY